MQTCHVGHDFSQVVFFLVLSGKGKDKGSCLESRLHDNACSTDFTFPLARWAPMQPATIDPTLDLCTRYPLQLGGPRQCGIQSLPDTSTHGTIYIPRSTRLIISGVNVQYCILGHSKFTIQSIHCAALI